MKRPGGAAGLASLCAAAALGLPLAMALAMAATADVGERQAFLDWLAPRWAPLGLLGMIAVVAAGTGAWRWHERALGGPARWVEQASVLVHDAAAPVPGPGPDPITPALHRLLLALVDERLHLRQGVEQAAAAARERSEQERERLAVLMGEIDRGVVLCGPDGRVRLYNEPARRMLEGPLAARAGWMGLGRPIQHAFDAALIEHAWQALARDRARGDPRPVTAFTTALPGGRLVRVQMVGLAAEAAKPPPATPAVAAAGCILLCEDVSQAWNEDRSRAARLAAWLDDGAAALASLAPGPAGVQRLHDWLARGRAQALEAGWLQPRWPLEPMRAADLSAAAVARLEGAGLQVTSETAPEPLWLRVDGHPLLQALQALAERLRDEREVHRVEWRIAAPVDPDAGSAGAARAVVELGWVGPAMSTETAMQWERAPLDPHRPAGTSVRDVLQRHGCELLYRRERARQAGCFHLSLAATPAPPPRTEAPRPVFYDFDLAAGGAALALQADAPLAALACTVFDTETTGLEPSAGDRIIQIGATRVVAGRWLPDEGFEQLVDPQRDVPALGIAIHGITAERLRGQPPIEQVLPAFHAYARDTVLVAHNAAFDLRFLQLQEAATGLRFDQPVLDTLLLSAVVHPSQPSHALEAIAARLGLAVQGRHSALADAVLTAQVFVRLLPLLAERGILTLGQAHAAAMRTPHASLRY